MLADHSRILFRTVAFLGLGLLSTTCGPVAPGNNHNHSGDGGDTYCVQGAIECNGTTARVCQSDHTWSSEECPSACVVGEGCVDCVPDYYYCEDNWRSICTADHTLEHVEECTIDKVCIMGECVTKCDPRVLQPSNVGCEFWAVDLDNEAVVTMAMTNDAAAQQFAVVLANVNGFPVQVQIFKNEARVGEPVNEVVVAISDIAAYSLARVDLPQREVDGTMGQNGTYAMDMGNAGSGTFVSPHAWRIVSNGPIVAYQFNPIIQQFSNDASLLIPRQTLGKFYYVMGWPTTNPCGEAYGSPMFMQSIPDHTSVTIIGVHENTVVTVNPTHPIMASGPDSGFEIEETMAGSAISFVINPYDVVNLESLQFIGPTLECMAHMDWDGDFTGTKVTSSMPVAVFSSNERGSGYGGRTAPKPPDPPNWNGETCCTDHLEEQMMPVTALGWKFAITRSPVRSTNPSYREPDIYRILATENGTFVQTSLDAPFDQFSLDAGKFATFYSSDPFTVESMGGAIMIGQVLVSQNLVPDGFIGDPSLTIYPPAEQYRKEYVFLIPPTFQKDYMVLAIPTTAGVEIDGAPVGEFPEGCTTEPVGTVSNVTYDQLTCLLPDGTHTVTATEPVGLTVYGYYNVGSYAYAGGADVKIINPVE